VAATATTASSDNEWIAKRSAETHTRRATACTTAAGWSGATCAAAFVDTDVKTGLAWGELNNGRGLFVAVAAGGAT
jgi:hypothetical protein